MKSRTPVLVILLIAATFFAGCAGKTNTTSSTAPGMTASVEMKGFLFKPDMVTIAKGGTVTWTNMDGVGHDVTAVDGSWSSGEPGGIPKDGTYPHTFADAGTYVYVCKAHGGTATGGMHGTVIVK